VVYVLGDVAWNRKALERLRCFPGIKKLVLGNHDGHDMRAYLECFRKVMAYHVLAKDILLAHVPVHPESLTPRYRLQAHGHTHGHTVNGAYVNVCVEQVDFRPVTLEWVTKQVSTERV
jgi:calcineurin-like phosphoesterase family protein